MANESSQQVKGAQMVGLVKGLRGLKEHARPLLTENLRPYFEERVLLTQWYPEEDLRDMVLLLGKLMRPLVEGDPYRAIGQAGARGNVDGAYSALIRMGDPEGTLKRFPDGWRQFRNHGVIEVTLLGPGSARVVMRNYAQNCKELAEVNAGYFEEVLCVAGAADAVVTVEECVPRSRSTWSVRWTPPMNAPGRAR